MYLLLSREAGMPQVTAVLRSNYEKFKRNVFEIEPVDHGKLSMETKCSYAFEYNTSRQLNANRTSEKLSIVCLELISRSSLTMWW